MKYPPTDQFTEQPRFAYLITNPLADFISVHFKLFNLPENDYVQVRPADPASSETQILQYRGNETNGSFYSTALSTSAVIVELFTESANRPQGVNSSQCVGFSVDSYQFLAQGSTLNGSKEEVCGADNSREAACYKSFNGAFRTSNAVARLLIKKDGGAFFCTGWLLGSEGHLVTNHHCISTQEHASNTEFEFNAEGSSCSRSCASPRACGGAIRANYATLIYADEDLDYALVKLPNNLASEYGYLRLRSSGAVMNERVYLPQHPSGWVATWATIANAQTATNSSGTPAGVQDVNFGVGCGEAVEYPLQTDDSTTQPQFAYTISNSLAQFVSIHFTSFNLPKNDYVQIRAANPSDPETTVLKYHGDDSSGDFYSTALQTTKVVVELFTQTTDPVVGAQAVNTFLCMGFTVDSYRFLAQPANNAKSQQEEVCGADESQQAVCYSSYTDAYKAAGAVARLLIHKSTGSFFCTGWLIGNEGHLITNNHCISQQAHASNTEFEFNAQGATCSTNCNKGMACGGKVRARSSTLIYADATLDYALVKLPINLSGEYGFLQLRQTGAVLSERIYIPQHPAGWGKHIAMKTDNGWGKVTSLNTNGCAKEQVAYMLDTQGGSSGSPVIAWSDNAVVALHHCGGCPNTAINSYKLINDMNSRNILPKNAVYSAATSAPTTAPTTSPPTQAPTYAPATKTMVDGTITSTATFTSVDYVNFKLSSDAVVELDILAMEEKSGGGYVDVNGDCNAGYIDSSIVLFSVNAATGAMTAIAANDNAPNGYGNGDGSISTADSYLYLQLTAGSYRLAVSASGLTPKQAANKQMPLSSKVRVCDKGTSNYGSYRLTISTSATVKVTGPGSYIGSQCNVVSPNAPFTQCPYHLEAAAAYATGVEGSIVRSYGAVSVDYIPFTVPAFNRITVEVASFGSADGTNFMDVNGNCESAYVDAVAYLFRSKSAGLSAADLVNSGDDDDSFVKRTHYRSISFRDPYLSLALPAGDYTLVVGRYPLSLEDAIARTSRASVDTLTPESCGKKSDRGNYLVVLSSANKVDITSPGSFSGSRCPSDVGKQVCTA
ncbi:hypothetical protein PR002_g8445 [Phytophthora rubi]|uniref:Serine protease n=1 Tax=Phytophthora rubi TaxID=129364 RepID=A0A6A3MXH9_9STRA|nr:hypothetical protein PR002_g8445 [Phytophthora rubi]